jgi:hypothetical protein
MFTHGLIVVSIIAAAFGVANAETHTIHFVNNCHFGTVSFVLIEAFRANVLAFTHQKPTLVSQNGQILSTGGDFVSNGPIVGAIAYVSMTFTNSCLLPPSPATYRREAAA